MTPLQQACLARLRATAEANAAFFEMNMPTHRRLLNESPKATIDISDQGDLTIRYEDGSTRSVARELLDIEAQIDRFADVGDRPQILAFHKLRQVADNPNYGDMQRYHYSTLDLEYANRVRWHFVKHYPDNSGLTRYPDFGGKHIPLLIVFGSGMGWHLPRLLLEYQIRHLIVIDTDLETFRLSVFFQDYVMLTRLAMEKGTDLTFIVQPDTEQVSNFLMQSMLRSHGLPPFFVHGASLFYAVEESEKIDAIRTSIISTLWELFFGLGYFDDELISIKHTFDNLRQNFPIYMKPQSIPKNAVAFVVGSGPSLDGLVPLLREYGDRAVIFSCGSAIGALARLGIKPDFHVEKERPYLVYDLLTKTVDAEFLKGIHFLGLNVVHADVFNLFESGGVIMKTADTMALLLAQHGMPQEPILSCQPTVTNAAIDFALSAGFDQVYLFGVDMGYKDTEQRHSLQTAYHQNMTDDEDLVRLLADQPESEIRVPGNFGGKVSTDKILSVARRMIGYMIARFPRANVYNLNDGAMIRGAEPLHKEDFALKQPADKAEVIAAVKGAFERKTFDTEALQSSLLEQIDRFIQDVADITQKPQRSRSDVIDKLSQIHQYAQSEVNRQAPSALLFRGAVFHLLSMTFNAITIIKDEDEVLAKASFDFSNLLDFLKAGRAEVVRQLSAEGAA